MFIAGSPVIQRAHEHQGLYMGDVQRLSQQETSIIYTSKDSAMKLPLAAKEDEKSSYIFPEILDECHASNLECLFEDPCACLESIDAASEELLETSYASSLDLLVKTYSPNTSN